MKAEELRIGNLVALSYATSGIFRITEIFKDKCMFYNDLNKFSSGTILNYIEPIPITEEWLLKFGFEETNHDSYFQTKKWSNSKNIITVDEEFFVSMETTFHAKCEYIHQLQNLYHALTGEELTLN